MAQMKQQSVSFHFNIQISTILTLIKTFIMQAKISRIVLLVFLSAVMCQCQNKPIGSHAKIVEVNGNKVIDCNISEVSDTIEFPLSAIVDKCEIILLETNEESLFKSVQNIGISENYIAVHSRGRMPIKLFDRKGEFIRNIGTIGRGPGEFNSLYGIQIDEPANKIYLTPFARAQKLIVLSLNDEKLPPIPLVYQQSKCKIHVENDVLTVLSMPFKMKDKEPIPIAYQQTIGGELIKEIKTPKHLAISPVNEKGQFVGFNSELSSSHNAGVCDLFTLTWGKQGLDTLYHYDTKLNKLLPKFVASFTGEKQGSWNRELKSHYWANIFGKKYKGAKVIVDKKTLKSDFFHLVDDFHGGFELSKFYTSNNGMFVASVPAFKLLETFKEVLKNKNLDSKMKEKIIALQKQLTNSSNEVLFVGEMI